ncbi:MAG TPA: phosphoribosylformylglycinamidine synthase subunit PurQ, partial [Mariprofundaceae bacterium]|nr:phosphoribosylformylglycinamidine synthase subunit PurQ [Mariprofundaceae bacterium]
VTHLIGHPRLDRRLLIKQGNRVVLDENVLELQQVWAETSYRLQARRDNPECADEAFAAIAEAADPGLHAKPSFDPAEDVAAPFIATGKRPPMAVLREQGVNGQVEMAAAFDRAGFDCVDVHMSDVIEGRVKLAGFKGLVACGGFSFGDVLGAGRGWASSILFNARARDEFEAFFKRSDSFALGVCNGCQMMSSLSEIIPGTGHWPRFHRNRSEQFEARLLMAEVEKSPSIFFAGMEGSRMPLVVSHGEGRAVFASAADEAKASACIRYLGADGKPAATYPHNPNGSPNALAGVTTADGRFTIMMPHPERLFRTVQYSWHPDGWGEDGPWLRMFRNARVWVG